MLVGVLAAIALLAAGCGSSSSGSSSGALTTELSYFPSQSPFVMTAQTGAKSSSTAYAKTLEAKLPTVAFAKAAIFGALSRQGINYQRDIAPLLGNPFAFGIASAGGNAVGSDFLAVWVTRDGSKLSALVHKLPVHSTGAIDGANLYATSAGWELAIDGATLVFGHNQPDVIAALSRHANNQGMTASEILKRRVRPPVERTGPRSSATSARCWQSRERRPLAGSRGSRRCGVTRRRSAPRSPG